MRDWFPISFMSTFTDWADLVHGPTAEWGQNTCGCHPNCGIGMAVMIDKETKEAVPVTAFLKGDQLAKDVAKGMKSFKEGMADDEEENRKRYDEQRRSEPQRLPRDQEPIALR